MPTPLSTKTLAAQHAVQESDILNSLKQFSPVVVSTIIVGLDTDQSDIDIVCTYQSQTDFSQKLRRIIANYADASSTDGERYTVGRFHFGGFLFEIYGSSTAVTEQNGYRHYRMMERLVDLGGTTFQTAIRALKRAGLKTEPAIAAYLNLDGDPYQAVLALEQLDTPQLQSLLHIAEASQRTTDN